MLYLNVQKRVQLDSAKCWQTLQALTTNPKRGAEKTQTTAVYTAP